MTENDFKTATVTVVATNPKNSGAEIWVRYEDGREAAYQVADSSFRCREGHQLTAVLYGQHPILLRNDSTRMKIQLHSGEDILGSGPQVEPRSASFWLGLFLICLCPPFGLICLIGGLTGYMWNDVTAPIKGLIAGIKAMWRVILGAGIILVILYFCLSSNAFFSLLAAVGFFAIVIGIPYAYIIQPRIRRAKHQRQIKALDVVVTRLFNQL